jgi:hypothetical protein
MATEELQHYAQGLLRENQKLRERTAALEDEQQQVRREAAGTAGSSRVRWRRR